MDEDKWQGKFSDPGRPVFLRRGPRWALGGPTLLVGTEWRLLSATVRGVGVAAISPTSERSIAHSCTDSALTRAPGSIDRLPVTKEVKLTRGGSEQDHSKGHQLCSGKLLVTNG